jgi:hypothetical protein
VNGATTPLLADVFVFILEGGLLFAMGRVLSSPKTFLYLWTALLVVDILWSLAVWIIKKREHKPKWVLNNCAWSVIAWVTWFAILAMGQGQVSTAHFATPACALAIIEVCRSVTDYVLNWKFYFPGDVEREG